MREIIPVLLGADLNCYGMARAFNEAYGVKSFAFGKCELGAIKYSRIVKFSKIPPLVDKRRVLDMLSTFAQTQNEKPYIFGCTDEYALFIIDNKSILSEHYICVCPEKDIIGLLSDKVSFYEKCFSLGLPYPEFVGINSPSEAEIISRLSFGFPMIIKPSSSSKYWRYPFDGMKKVYTVQNRAEAERTVNEIFGSGYGDKIIIQRKIEGEQYVATCFSENGETRAVCAGRVLLGENTPKGLGNHVAVITEKQPEIENLVETFLSAVNYTGFSNFDIMRDGKTGKFYLLEINPRQGRSNYYMTAAGMNPAELVVESKSNLPFEEVFWHCVPKKIVMQRVSEEDAKKIRLLSAAKKSFSSLHYARDMINPLRFAYIIAHNIAYFGKYDE